jgi:hypothetical protein
MSHAHNVYASYSLLSAGRSCKRQLLALITHAHLPNTP